MKTYAYCRVSSRRKQERQTTESQRAALQAYCRQHRIRPTFIEDWKSGRTTNRSNLQRMLDALQPGDSILVTDLSRFSRNLRDTLRLIEDLTANDVTLTATNQGLTFDRSAMSTFMLQVFAALAELDSNVKSERIKNGLAVARANGTRLGRAPDNRKRQAVQKLRAKGMPVTEIATKYGTSRSAVYQMLKRV